MELRVPARAALGGVVWLLLLSGGAVAIGCGGVLRRIAGVARAQPAARRASASAAGSVSRKPARQSLNAVGRSSMTM
ncbi:MAG: hypothetical protein QOG63_1922 [Thermoleophilaceae bacterium]|nr:hypothetical protein [Thermoleophilaceae bacterium]